MIAPLCEEVMYKMKCPKCGHKWFGFGKKYDNDQACWCCMSIIPSNFIKRLWWRIKNSKGCAMAANYKRRDL